MLLLTDREEATLNWTIPQQCTEGDPYYLANTTFVSACWYKCGVCTSLFPWERTPVLYSYMLYFTTIHEGAPHPKDCQSILATILRFHACNAYSSKQPIQPLIIDGWHSATITSAWSSQDGEIGYVDTKQSILLSLAQTEHQTQTPFLDHAKLWLPFCVGRAPDRSQRQIVGKLTLCSLQNMICPKVGDFWADDSIFVKSFSPYFWVSE